MNKHKTILISSFIILLINFNSGFAVTTTNQSLYLKIGSIYLFSFDEKILNYDLNNRKAARVEILSNILTDKQELLLEPLENIDNNLIIKTRNAIYDFNIKSLKNSESDNLSECLINIQNKVYSFELDKPPEAR